MKNKKVRILIILVITISMLAANTLLVSANEKLYVKNRIYGQDRIETSIKIASEYIRMASDFTTSFYTNNGKAQYMVLATAYNFPDALAGGVLAAKYDAPILLVGNTVSESQGVLDFMKSHLSDGGKVFILGGTGVVSSDIEDAVRNLGVSNIERLGGEDRAETSKAINSALNISEGSDVIITTENDFPDALSVSSFAIANNCPILLSDKDNLPQPTIDLLQKIKPRKVYVIGGEGVISECALSQIKNITNNTSGDSIKRVWGSDRYATSLEIAKEFSSLKQPYSNNAVLATGENFPDALCGSTLALKEDAPIILINDDKANIQKQYIDSTNIDHITFLGGTGSISSAVEDTFKTYEKQAEGLNTPYGIVTSKIKYDDPITAGKTFDELESEATAVSPKYNPELFTYDKAEWYGYNYVFDVNKMALTNKLYEYGYSEYIGKWPQPVSYIKFIKILGFYYDYDKKAAFVVYSSCSFIRDNSIGSDSEVGTGSHVMSQICSNSMYEEYLKNEK